LIEIWSWPTPNGEKVHIAIEELGLPYTLVPVDIGAGEQFKPEFLAITPNHRIPAIVDDDGPDGRFTLFESGAILIYLAEKAGRLIPNDAVGRYKCLEWLMFQMGGIGPMFGQYNHFANYAPEKIPYAIERYTNEGKRLMRVLDKRLTESEHLAGRDYSIADIASFPWVNSGVKRGAFDLDETPAVKRWLEGVAARPGVERGLAIMADKRRPPHPDRRATHHPVRRKAAREKVAVSRQTRQEFLLSRPCGRGRGPARPFLKEGAGKVRAPADALQNPPPASEARRPAPGSRRPIWHVAPDAGRRKIQRRPGFALGHQPVLLPGQGRGDAVAVENETEPRRHRLDGVDEAPLLGHRQQNQRNAAYHSTNAAMPFGGNELRQPARIALYHLRPRQCATQMAGHVRHDFDHEELAGRQAGIEQGAADHAGAGAEFDHRLVGRDMALRHHPPAQRRRRRHDGAHLQRIAHPAFEEQAGIGNVLAKRRAVGLGLNGLLHR
jgi:GST-like protein